MSKQFNAAIVGCGAIYQNHVAGIQSSENARLVALCEINPDKTAALATLHQLPVYLEYSRLLEDPSIDVIHLCVPHWLHTPMACQALKAGKHVFCEKPSAISPAEITMLREAKKQSGKMVGVCLQNRYNESSIRCKSLLESGKLGAITGGRATVFWSRDAAYYQESGWRGKLDTEGGGVLINQSIHTLDLLQWLIGGRVRALTGSCSTKFLTGIIEVEDTADALLLFESGARGVFFATNSYVVNAPVEIEVQCEKGSVKITGNTLTTCFDDQQDTLCFSPEEQKEKGYWGEGHTAIIRHFYSCLAEGIEFPVGIDAIAAPLAIISGIFESSRTGQTVNPDYR